MLGRGVDTCNPLQSSKGLFQANTLEVAGTERTLLGLIGVPKNKGPMFPHESNLQENLGCSLKMKNRVLQVALIWPVSQVLHDALQIVEAVLQRRK